MYRVHTSSDIPPLWCSSLSRNDCELLCEAQELSRSSSPPSPTLSLWQMQRSEHENWMAGQHSSDRIKTALNVEGAAAWRDCICALYSSSWVFSTFIWTVPHVFACSTRCASLCRSFCCWFVSLWCINPHLAQTSTPCSWASFPLPCRKPGAKSQQPARPARRLGALGCSPPAAITDPRHKLVMMAGDTSWDDWAKAELQMSRAPGFESQNEPLCGNCKAAYKMQKIPLQK